MTYEANYSLCTQLFAAKVEVTVDSNPGGSLLSSLPLSLLAVFLFQTVKMSSFCEPRCATEAKQPKNNDGHQIL